MDCTESRPVLETAVVKRDKTKVENIQALRGLAALMVVVSHIGLYEGRIFPSRALLPRMEPLGDAGVDLFFVISGFVMVTITQGQFQHYSGALTFFLRRAARIYPLYWFYTLLYLPLFLFYPSMMNRPGGAQGISLTKSFLLLPGEVAPLIGQGWTLIHEMYFYLGFALILLAPKSARIRLLAAWTLIIVVACCMGTGVLGNSPTLALIFHPMTLEFLAGCGMAWLVARGCNKIPRLTLLLGTVLFAATLCLALPWHRVALHLVPFSLLVYGATVMETSRDYCFPRWLRFLGDISYSLYLSHSLVLAVLKILYLRLNLQWPILSNLVFMGVALAATVGAAAISYFCVEKVLMKHAYALVQRFSRPRRDAVA